MWYNAMRSTAMWYDSTRYGATRDAAMRNCATRIYWAPRPMVGPMRGLTRNQARVSG